LMASCPAHGRWGCLYRVMALWKGEDADEAAQQG
jgi:hypothetical protein